ncbi:hypothetical protein I4U23_000112 [Adineta vaga]|nr:hypothetical protein I4U23_000112 [Adineta vaga]
MRVSRETLVTFTQFFFVLFHFTKVILSVLVGESLEILSKHNFFEFEGNRGASGGDGGLAVLEDKVLTRRYLKASDEHDLGWPWGSVLSCLAGQIFTGRQDKQVFMYKFYLCGCRRE